jgi:hypothetical protein
MLIFVEIGQSAAGQHLVTLDQLKGFNAWATRPAGDGRRGVVLAGATSTQARGAERRYLRVKLGCREASRRAWHRK